MELILIVLACNFDNYSLVTLLKCHQEVRQIEIFTKTLISHSDRGVQFKLILHMDIRIEYTH